MKINTQSTAAISSWRLVSKHILACAFLALSVPLAATAQQTVFYDTFATSSLDQTNIPGGIPGGAASDVTPFSATSYTIGSAKNALNTSVASGHLKLIQSATSSGNLDSQALFTKYPVSLAAVGDYVELTYTFTDTVPIMQNTRATSTALFLGLFNSGGIAPQSGTVLQNGGLSASLSTGAQGGTKDWVGYSAQDYNGTAWRIYARPAQTTVNNGDQGLLYNYPNSLANGGAITPPSPNLTPGQQYTVQLRVTLSAVGQLTISNALYTGTDTTGAQFTNTSWLVTGANVLTTNFDSLAIGYRAGDSISWTNDINSIKVVAGLAAQAGPYYFVTSSGNPCAGGLTIGLSGSVATNVYWLLTNGVNSGQSVAGTGSPIDFGLQTAPATYTISASNTVTSSQGPMYGSASVVAPGITISTQPASVSVVSNLPASISVQAVGNSLAYQWYKNGVALTNGGTFSGATSAMLNISAAQPSDAATSSDGYTVVIEDPCGTIVTSSPPAALTLTAPRNLVWAGANPDNTWDYVEQNFTLSSSPALFMDGDNVLFGDSSPNTSVTISTNVTATLASVTGSQSYSFGGPGKLTGVSQLVDSSSGVLSVFNNNDYSGGTVVSNGSTLTLGDGASAANNGLVAGVVTVSNTATLNYNYAGSGTTTAGINNGLAGSGTVNFNTLNGSTIATLNSAISSSFNGTINIQGFTRLHASDNNSGYALGNGSTVNVPDNTQIWLDRSATPYNNTFNIGGNGWPGVNPATGAMLIFGCTVSGPVNLMDNTRIGGTINGGTITGPITGIGYQLEVLGNVNSYILSVSNSANAWGNTLVTSGAIRALAAGSISTNSMTIDLNGELDVFGNNVSINSLNDGPSGTGVVYNKSTSAAGTLTLGADGTSTAFDGVFADGASKPLNLTKVGLGTLTLTAVSTNTGSLAVNGGTLALSGSGSFNKASVIAPASGATFDVSGVGGTLTLNSGQTLKGSGTVNGNVVANAGSTVNPGDGVGTIHITGNLSLSGTLLLELNRTNAPLNDKIAVTGTFTPGGTLAVTNVGSGLQVGDSFQLFSTGTSGFAAFNLQTNDPVNNLTYTWNNTIATDGKISVASVGQLVNTNPAPITLSASGGNLTLSWPPDHTGYTLQAQTNSVGAGLGTNWVNVTGSVSTNQITVPINSTNGSVFYRLKYSF
jgi:autotransporter-associated beta strand protein